MKRILWVDDEIDLLKPHLEDSDIEPVARIILGTVKGDIHDIGKNLVGMMSEGAGFTIVDLGTDTSADEFIAAVKMGFGEEQ